MNCGVYLITSPSGKKYVGSSYNIDKRFYQHKYRLNKGTHHNRHLQNAWIKYEGNLKFKTLLICSKEDLLFYEQLVIDGYKPEYNIAKSSDKAFYALGVKRTEETKDKIRQAHLGKPKKSHPHTEESKRKLSEALKGNKNGLGNKANLGRKLSEEHRRNTSNGLKGRKISEEQKKFLSESRKGAGNPMFGKTPWNKKNDIQALENGCGSEGTSQGPSALPVIRRAKEKESQPESCPSDVDRRG